MAASSERGARSLETATQEDESWASDEVVRVPGLTILYHPDLRRVGERALLTGLGGGQTVRLSRLEPPFAAPGATGRPQPLGDPRVSRQPLLLRPGASPGTVELDRGDNRTGILVNGVALGEKSTFSGADLERGVVLLAGGQTVLLLHRLSPLIDPDLPCFGLIGESPGVVSLRQDIRQVADLAVAVLLRGETGTGKELVALAVHEASPRRGGPLVAVNMAAIPPSLAAAELFGAVKGAFTGADRRRAGYFSRARGGTLFLDEIGETPPEVQPLLLRALDSGEIQPVGAAEAERVDVRVIAATDAELEDAVSAGRFRAPLLHRLSGFQIRLPPLRERREDLGRLLVAFLTDELGTIGETHRLGRADQPWLPGHLVARLAAYAWPGNVRQLRNVVRQLVIANRGGDQVRLDASTAALLEATPPGSDDSTAVHPPRSLQGDAAARAPEEAAAPDVRDTVPRRAADVSEQELIDALRVHRWQPHAAARALGLPRSSIYDLIAKSPNLRTAADLGRREIESASERHAGHLEAMAGELRVSERALRRRMRELGVS